MLVSFHLDIILPKCKVNRNNINILYSPNGRLIEDLYSPDPFHIHTGEEASANFQH